MAKLFVCNICGEPYIGQGPPDDCPFCGAPQQYLVSIEEHIQLWDTELTEQEKTDMRETLDLEVNATAYYKKVSDANKKYSKYNRLFKQLARVEKEHAEIAAKFLNIELSELEGEEPKGSVDEDLKRTKELEKHAIKKYTRFMAHAKSKHVKNFYVALTHAEQGHFELVS